MKKMLFLLINVCGISAANAQNSKADTNYATRIVSATWMPDGRSFLLAVVKFHKTDRQAPFYSKIMQYDLKTGMVSQLFEDGSSLSVSPDGKSIAFMKRSDPKRVGVYLYDAKTKKQTLLKTDTMRKSAMAWSPDGKKIAYNISLWNPGRSTPVEICVFDFTTGQTKQVTQSAGHKSYSPAWSPNSNRIVYYVEKGDGRDQIWLTDADGSFHTNLSNDTSAHNFFPSWMNDSTIIYTSSPASAVMMKADGANRQKIAGIEATELKYNAASKKFIYILSEAENKVMMYDMIKRKARVILNGPEMINKF
jgi:Tol biopolymer transport system component